MSTLLRFWARQRKVRTGRGRSEPEPGLPVSDGGACLPAKPWQDCSWSLRLPTSPRAQALARMLLGTNRGDSDSLGASLGLTFQNSAGSEGLQEGANWLRLDVGEEKAQHLLETGERSGAGGWGRGAGQGTLEKEEAGGKQSDGLNQHPASPRGNPASETHPLGTEPATRTSKQRSLPAFAPADHCVHTESVTAS